MRIIITGGAGFIGSHLTKTLLNQDHTIICIDNLYTGNKQNIQPFLKNPKYRFIQHDITQPIDENADQIYNLACPASPPHYQKDPIYTLKTNLFGTNNMLELAHRYGATILQASTSEIYGDPQQHPQKETYWGNVNPIGPRSCYDEGKRAAETLCTDYNKQHKVQTRIARIFNTYGPNMSPNDGRVISTFITQALKNKPITIYGDGTQTRSFCYVTDLIDGLTKLMNSKLTTPINLGNPDEHTIQQIAEQIKKLTNSKSEITHKPLPQDDPKQRKPDITLAKTKLNWQPKVDLKTGLTQTITYFR